MLSREILLNENVAHKKVEISTFQTFHRLTTGENAAIVLCRTRVNKFQGTGCRLFCLGHCLREGVIKFKTRGVFPTR